METTIAPRKPPKDKGRKKAKDSVVRKNKTKPKPSPAPAPPPPAKSDPEPETNFILVGFSTKDTDFTAAPLDLTKVGEPEAGALTYPDGNDRRPEKTGRDRLTAVMGPGSTIRGVAQILLPLFNKVAQPPLTAEELADALTQYNSRVLKPEEKTRWKVGVVLPLPIEVKPGTTRLIVDINRIRQLDRERGATAPETERRVQDLAVPSVASVAQDVTTKNRAAASPAARGQQLARDLIDNPFEPVFEAIETLRRYAGGPGGPTIATAPTADEQACAEALAGELSGWQTNQLGRLTAGNAVLRRVWRALRPRGTTPATATAEQVGRFLGLRHDADGTWHDPLYYFIKDQENKASPVPTGPLVEPLELRVHDAHLSMVNGKPIVGKTKGIRNKHEMAFGRDLDVGHVERFREDGQDVTGTDFTGTVDPASLLGTPIPARDPAAAATVAQRVNVVARIPKTEGKLDSCRSADKGLLSFGIQQWTMNDNEEGTTFLHRFRQQAPDHFDLHFGRHGLQTVLSVEGNPSGEVADPEGTDRASAERKNAPWFTTGLLADGRPTYVTLRRLRPGVDLVHNAATSLPIGSDRAEFFGASVVRGRTFMTNTWSAYARVVGLLSLDFQRGQLELATLRFDRLIGEVTTPFKVPGPGNTKVERTMQQLFTSEFGAGLIIDTHINQPNKVESSIRDAIGATKGVAVRGGVLSEEWATRLMTNFLQVRGIPKKVKKGRNANLLQLHDNGLSSRPGSFTGW